MNHRKLLIAAGLSTALATQALLVSALGKEEAAKAAPKGSISVSAGKHSKAELGGMATFSYDEALKAAHEAVPGKVISGVLEAEDGNLQYAFEVLVAGNKIDEVEIDAGNGKVLGIDHDDKD